LISNTDAWADENLLQGQINWSTTPVSYYPNTSIIDLAHNAGTKVMVSIGGWTLSDNFPTIAASCNKTCIVRI
jgi:chitinase